MKLQVPFVQLPLQFDATRLAHEMHALGEAVWRPHPQKFPGNFALPLISVDGDPESDSIAGPMRPTPYLEHCPYLTQVLAKLGAVWGRARLMKLTGGAEVTPHADINYYWRDRVRVHVPILTQPAVRFLCGESEVNMGAGECWIFDTWRPHRVINAAERERVHLVADTVGSESFWGLVNHGRVPGLNTSGDWQASPVAALEGSNSPLLLENVNVPRVMSPWELREHFAFILHDVAPHPQQQQIQSMAARLFVAWQALWAEYGDSEAGWPTYRIELDNFAAAIKQLAAEMHLINGMRLSQTLHAMVLKVALGDREQAVLPDEYLQPAVPKERVVADKADDLEFDRPIFIVSSPRSGSTLLFETLALAPNLFTTGRESHGLIESIPGLRLAMSGFGSNRLDETAAMLEVAVELRHRFLSQLRDREGHSPMALPLRMLEKTPKNSLRIPFLAKVFPQARFVYLYRDPRQTLSSMIEAWQSGRFRTYPNLPGWDGLPWSMTLVPGWRDLVGESLPRIVAAQWTTMTRIMLDDLETLPADRIAAIDYDAFLADPQTQITALCASLGITWDQNLKVGELPPSRYTLTRPAADKWRRHQAEIEAVLPEMHEIVARAQLRVGAMPGKANP